VNDGDNGQRTKEDVADKRDENADGIWDDDTKTIYVRKRLPVTRRRYILAHELGHAWLDWQHRYMDDGKAST
jgi:Zn-dependent peptidase ImmA (M78 family)